MPRLVLMFVTGLTVLNGAVDSALAQQTWQSEWEKTIAAAKKEGKVVVGLPPSAELRKELEPAFKARFGFGMEIFSATGPQIANRVVTEGKAGMRYFEGMPDFAAEVRGENDYGEAAEEAMAAKRADNFAAGTRVVWDVDLQSEAVVRKYTADKPLVPTAFHRGQAADAEPAVPGRNMPVDELFEPPRTGTLAPDRIG